MRRQQQCFSQSIVLFRKSKVKAFAVFKDYPGYLGSPCILRPECTVILPADLKSEVCAGHDNLLCHLTLLPLARGISHQLINLHLSRTDNMITSLFLSAPDIIRGSGIRNVRTYPNIHNWNWF